MAPENCTNCVFTRPSRGGDESPLVSHAAANNATTAASARTPHSPLLSVLVLVRSQILLRPPDEGRGRGLLSPFCLALPPAAAGCMSVTEQYRGK